jgi:DNA-binding XRE family transcriptional regulator
MRLAEKLEMAALRNELDHARITVSRAINVLEQVKIAIEEGDTDEALRLIAEATS